MYAGVVFGTSDSQSAYRSELYGLYRMVQLVHATYKKHGLKEGRVELACDGESALFRMLTHTYTPTPNEKHYDILAAAKHLIDQCNIEWLPRHVRGHQDDKGGALDFWERNNVLMDKRAKEEWARTVNLPNTADAPTEQCSAWAGNWRLCGQYDKALREHIHTHTIQGH